MEHRNSAVMRASASIRGNRQILLDAVAHEFFHSWNVERIRPRSLEPFDLERANMSGELWLAEGFTQYYGPLVLQRSGLSHVSAITDTLSEFVEAVVLGPGRAVRSAEDMSRMAPFVDGSRPLDRTNFSNTFISYYAFGGAIALALDLTLRERSDSQITLDDYMRAMWRIHGKPGGTREGLVDRPYSIADAEARLAEVSGDREFAREFFGRYIQGHEAADYARLLAQAGIILRKRNPGRAWWGDVRLEPRSGRLQIVALVPANTPAYAAGLEQDHELRQIDALVIRSYDELAAALGRHKPSDRIRIVYVDRNGVEKTTTVVLAEDPHVELVPVESAGGALTPAQRTFRDRWLGPR